MFIACFSNKMHIIYDGLKSAIICVVLYLRI